MALSTEAVKRLMIAVCSPELGNEISTAINEGLLLADQSNVTLAAIIAATSVSPTTDFGALKVADKVLHFSALGGSSLLNCLVAGDLGQAAVIGDIYMVLRPVNVASARTNQKF